MYYVYLLKCKDESIYTGISTDVKRRFKEHKAGTASKYTRSRGALRIIYTESQKDRSSATKRECEIKSWPREKKLGLCSTKTKAPATSTRKMVC